MAFYDKNRIEVDLKNHSDKLPQKLKILEGLTRGEKAIHEGRLVPHDDAEKRMERWLK